MKNLFVLIAAFFGAGIVSLLGGVVFSLYNFDTVKIICFIAAAVFFTAFIIVVTAGYIMSAKAKKSASQSKDKAE